MADMLYNWILCDFNAIYVLIRPMEIITYHMLMGF